MREIILVADGGGTKTRAVAILDDGSRFESVGGPCVPFMDLAGALRTIEVTCRTLLAQADVRRQDAMVYLSLASAGLDSDDITSQFQRTLLEGFDRVSLLGDGEAALEACCRAGPGAIIAIGTGVAISGRWRDGQLFAMDGWGWPAGDRGGGAWIGRHVAEQFLAAHDRDELHGDPFLAFLSSVIGSSRASILHWLNKADRQRYASLARHAIDWAARSMAAYHIAMLAVWELADIGRHLNEKGLDNIYITGGLGSALMPFLDAGKFQLRRDATFEGAMLRACEWNPNLQQGS
ncbi:BadF/BadG/BcrA/BcrD ATPase family protein [Agrobacterium vitis]|uniref:BadF/BadG/BcrA/BcrD ATPase family protein n=1 Tax=Agrobacterium vitis TaxID=373 RepID=UPI0012E839D6|nr:hypothetical protein [Agrobacterium vitis]